MAWIIKEKWLWIIILAIITVFTIPLIAIWVILYLPSEMKLVFTILTIIGWGVAAGYKDWVTAKKREEEKQKRDELS